VSIGQEKPQAEVVFYVAKNGNDAWSGKLPEPNAKKTNGPFATLERARSAVRTVTSPGAHPSVRIKGGMYGLTRSLVLDSADSGSRQHPIIWGAFERDTVRFVGGIAIGKFTRVREQTVLERMSPRYRDSILVTNLLEQGISDFGTPPHRMSLFFRGARMPVARYPNNGWLHIADVPQIESNILNPGDKKVIKNGLPAGRHSGRTAAACLVAVNRQTPPNGMPRRCSNSCSAL
jgi:hypothetical protein